MNFRLKKFLSYYKPYLGMFFSVMFCAFIAAATTLVFPLLTRYITKTVLVGSLQNALSEIFRVGAIMLALVVLKTVCNHYYDYRGHAMGAMMERDMRNELFEHYQKLSYGFYDERKTGELMSRITNDLLSLSELYHHGPEDYIVYLVRFIGTLIILLNINVKLTIAVFLFLPIMAIFALYFNKRMLITLRKNKECIADVNSQVEDNLSGIRVVKSFTNEEIEKKKFVDKNNSFLESRISTYKNEAYLYNGMNALIQLITVVVVVFGGVSIVRDSLDLADLITFLLYTGNLIEPVQKLTHMTMQFQEGIASFERFIEILDVKPENYDSTHSVDMKNIQGNLKFNLNYS